MGEDGVCEGTHGSFALGACNVDDIQTVQVTSLSSFSADCAQEATKCPHIMSEALQPTPHLRKALFVRHDLASPSLRDDMTRRLQAIQVVDGILHILSAHGTQL